MFYLIAKPYFPTFNESLKSIFKSEDELIIN